MLRLEFKLNPKKTHLGNGGFRKGKENNSIGHG